MSIFVTRLLLTSVPSVLSSLTRNHSPRRKKYLHRPTIDLTQMLSTDADRQFSHRFQQAFPGVEVYKLYIRVNRQMRMLCQSIVRSERLGTDLLLEDWS